MADDFEQLTRIAEQRCRRIAEENLPKDRYEIRRTMGWDSKCVIDFKRKGFTADVDCEEQCESTHPEMNGDNNDGENFEACVENCEERRKNAEVGSIAVNDEESVQESTIPVSCNLVWQSEGMIGNETKKFEKKVRNLEKSFREIGCTMEPGWIHPHELAGGAEAEMEDPAICYLHMQAAEKGKCNIKNMLKIIEKKT